MSLWEIKSKTTLNNLTACPKQKPSRISHILIVDLIRLFTAKDVHLVHMLVLVKLNNSLTIPLKHMRSRHYDAENFWNFRLEDLQFLLKKCLGTLRMVIINSPHNPTGARDAVGFRYCWYRNNNSNNDSNNNNNNNYYYYYYYKPSIFDGLYHPFIMVIRVMVYCCYTHITHLTALKKQECPSLRPSWTRSLNCWKIWMRCPSCFQMRHWAEISCLIWVRFQMTYKHV